MQLINFMLQYVRGSVVSGNETRGRAHASRSAHARSERPRVGFERARVDREHLPSCVSTTNYVAVVAILLSSLLDRAFVINLFRSLNE